MQRLLSLFSLILLACGNLYAASDRCATQSATVAEARDEQTHPDRYYLAAAAIFQDEAPYLKEWIEYHKLIGVEHF